MKVRIILCDDDPFFLSVGRDVIEGMARDEGLPAEVVCLARSGGEALSFLEKNEGEYLVFLDLDFGKDRPTGLDVAGLLRRCAPRVRFVFTTNHHEMALSVLKSGVEPFGFLEKTGDLLTLRDGYRRYICMASHAMTAHAMSGHPDSPSSDSGGRRLSLSLIGGETVEVLADDVVYVESEKTVSHGVTFHTAGGSRLTVVGTLEAVEARLGPSFLRVHRSVLANRAHVIGLQDGWLRLSNQEEVPCALRKLSEVKKWIARR